MDMGGTDSGRNGFRELYYYILVFFQLHVYKKQDKAQYEENYDGKSQPAQAVIVKMIEYIIK